MGRTLMILTRLSPRTEALDETRLRIDEKHVVACYDVTEGRKCVLDARSYQALSKSHLGACRETSRKKLCKIRGFLSRALQEEVEYKDAEPSGLGDGGLDGEVSVIPYTYWDRREGTSE